VQQASYNITGTVATPTMNPAGGTYQTSQSVVISCSTAGVTIRYTIDGSDPTDTSMIYANPIICPLDSYTLIKARAYKQDWLPSPIANSSYWITGTVATPSFDPSGGTYIGAQTVTISCATPGAQIRYTTDGTMPTVTSFLYTAPLAVNTTTTLKARGFKDSWIASEVASAVYTINGTVASPTFDPPAGDYEEEIDVVISCSTPGAIIRYTSDGSEPNASSEIYGVPLHLDQDTTLRAKAYLSNWAPSATVTAVYQISVDVDDPHAVPLYTGIHQVYPNPFAENATIRMGFKDANSSYVLNIYNIRGELVHQSSGMAKGYVNHSWNGCDNRGRKLPSGVYLIALHCNGSRQTKKIVLR